MNLKSELNINDLMARREISVDTLHLMTSLLIFISFFMSYLDSLFIPNCRDDGMDFSSLEGLGRIIGNPGGPMIFVLFFGMLRLVFVFCRCFSNPLHIFTVLN